MPTKSSTRGVRQSARRNEGPISSVGQFSQNDEQEFERIKLRSMEEI